MEDCSADNIPQFSSAQEEARYWRQKALEYQRIGNDARLELEEYQENSREVEAELEAQLKQAEAQVRDLRSNNNRLHFEHNSIKEKFEALSRDHYNRVHELEAQVAKFKADAEETTKRIRQLEQTNDDLERANRVTLGSLEDFETRLHTAIERNAFLESELDDKESLAVMVHRLKDETKELKQELQVRQKAIHETPDNEKQQQAINGGSPTHKTAAVLDENNEKRDPTKSPTPAGYNNNNKLPNGSNNATPLKLGMTDAGISQAARHSALNIVGDLLRRVGGAALHLEFTSEPQSRDLLSAPAPDEALENKLSTCRTMVKEGNGTGVKEANRGKMLTRGTSTTNAVQSIIRA